MRKTLSKNWKLSWSQTKWRIRNCIFSRNWFEKEQIGGLLMKHLGKKLMILTGKMAPYLSRGRVWVRIMNILMISTSTDIDLTLVQISTIENLYRRMKINPRKTWLKTGSKIKLLRLSQTAAQASRNLKNRKIFGLYLRAQDLSNIKMSLY